METRESRILDAAEKLFAGRPDWSTFHRKILGVGGMMETLYVSMEEREAFMRTSAYETIQQMLCQLRTRRKKGLDEFEPTKMITVRLPASMHDVLREEAKVRRTSMNKLCISKLLQMIENEMVPPPSRRRRAAVTNRVEAMTNGNPIMDRDEKPAEADL